MLSTSRKSAKLIKQRPKKFKSHRRTHSSVRSSWLCACSSSKQIENLPARVMSDIQATIEFQVELGKFYNVDLYQRGFYQIRVSLNCISKTACKIEEPQLVDHANHTDSEIRSLPSVINRTAVSKTFQILYRHEEINICDVFRFKVHTVVNANKINESLRNQEFQISIELWFTDQDCGSHKDSIIGPDKQEKMTMVTNRLLKVHVEGSQGVHHAIPVLFDYFHLSAIYVTVHSALTTLQQPYINLNKNQKNSNWSSQKSVTNPATLETLLFGDAKPVTCNNRTISNFDGARIVYENIAKILLDSYNNLQTNFKTMFDIQRASYKESFSGNFIGDNQTLLSLRARFLEMKSEEDILEFASTSISSLCGKNVICWEEFLKLVTVNKRVTHYLAKEHHKLRVKRFAEGFFSEEHEKRELLTCYKQSKHSHESISNMVRSSQYMQLIPKLSCECTELDGANNDLPIVFEDIFTDNNPTKIFRTKSQCSTTESNSTWKSSTSSESSIARNKIRTKNESKLLDPKRNSVALEDDKCTLIGYRKLSQDNFNSKMSIGTFSNYPYDLNKQIGNNSDENKTGTDSKIVADLSIKTDSASDYILPSENASSSIELKDKEISNENEDKVNMTQETSSEISGLKNNIVDGGENGAVAINYTDLANDLSTALGEKDTENSATENDQSIIDDSIRLSESNSNNNGNACQKAVDIENNCKVNNFESNTDETSKIDEINNDNGVNTPEETDDSEDGGKIVSVMELLKAESNRPPRQRLAESEPNLNEKDSNKNEQKYDEMKNSLQKGGLHMSVSTPAISNMANNLKHYEISKKKTYSSDSTVKFFKAKEELRVRMDMYNGKFFSDFATQAAAYSYFYSEDLPKHIGRQPVHLIVCVHGLDGNSADLRLVRTYLELCLPGGRLDFLMSESNQSDTFVDFDLMTNRLIDEMLRHIDVYDLNPGRISFIGHSLGNIIIRSALSSDRMIPLRSKMYTFLSLSGPHLGTVYNTSTLVSLGMSVMQKWKKSDSLLQLSLKDDTDPRNSFLYKLSQKAGLEFFKNILLVGSEQDRYVPYHSSRIEICQAAQRDRNTALGGAYCEMVGNLLQPIIFNSDITLARYDVFHSLGSSAQTFIGRAAHIAVLDADIFIEKFVSIVGIKYFK